MCYNYNELLWGAALPAQPHTELGVIMKNSKRSWKNIIYILVVFIAVVLVFSWYSAVNKDRIEEQNLNYAIDSAQQTARRLDGEFRGASQRVRTYTYLIEYAEAISNITPKLLKELEDISVFDAFWYINADGTGMSSDGTTYDATDRPYFTSGMNGERGSLFINKSRITGDSMMVFYSPLKQGEEVTGVLIGAYLAKDYLQELISTEYFDVPTDVYLCASDGTVITNTGNPPSDDKPFPDYLLEKGIIDEETNKGAWEVFNGAASEKAVFCDYKLPNRITDNICFVRVPNTNYLLVQMYPLSVTQNMINQANRTGMILQVALIVMFAVYIVVLVIQARKERIRLEHENTELGYITSGTSALFNRFVLVDLEKDTYRYLLGTTPLYKELAISGKYEDFVKYICAGMASEEDRQEYPKFFAKEAVIEELSDENKDAQYEYRLSSDGETFWEHMNIVCLERKDGKATKVLYLRQDITRLKERELKTKSEIAVANRKERQYMTATMSDAICSYEINLTHDYIGQEIAYHDESYDGKSLEYIGVKTPCRATDWFDGWKKFVDEESIEEYSANANVEYLRDCFNHGKREAVIEYWINRPSGTKHCLRQSFFMTWDDETNDIMAMVIIKEITEQVQRQREQVEALQDALIQAQHANNAKTTFLNNMSHDIRTPMNAIIGFTTIAASHIDNKDQVRDCLQKVLSSSNHLLSLINDILDMSRIESGKVHINEQECNISELTHNLVNIIQPQIKAKQLELFIDTFDVANEDVITDSLKLSQIFLNLLSNSVKYTPAGGTVSFRIIQDTTFHHGVGDYTFIVKDNGIGMSPEFVEHIFEPFERESSVTKTGIQGTGLGMAITKNIVEMMGGTISVKSEKNKGSEFIVKISLKLQDEQASTSQIKELDGLRAMVVDDDPDSCDSVSKMLKQLGMRAEWTTSGKEAVYRARNAHNEGDGYHTYILDWQMPEMSGVEVARSIRKAVGNDAPIIILTAYDWSDIEQDAKEAGVTAFCAKPLFMSDLKSALLLANNLIDKNDNEKAPWTDADFKGKRVLLVEDNEINREIAEVILDEVGLEVETAPDGTDAVSMMEKAPENYYDAILMDVQMPVMDGYEATRTIRAMKRNDVKTLPIIAMTANAMEEDKENALTSGMNAHVAKPIDTKLLMDVLAKYLNN